MTYMIFQKLIFLRGGEWITLIIGVNFFAFIGVVAELQCLGEMGI